MKLILLHSLKCKKSNAQCPLCQSNRQLRHIKRLKHSATFLLLLPLLLQQPDVVAAAAVAMCARQKAKRMCGQDPPPACGGVQDKELGAQEYINYIGSERERG